MSGESIAAFFARPLGALSFCVSVAAKILEGVLTKDEVFYRRQVGVAPDAQEATHLAGHVVMIDAELLDL